MLISDLILLASTASRGISIALTGMLIVLSALLMISAFIASLPKILGVVAEIWPENDPPHVGKTHPESFVPDDEAVLAAIGYVLRLRSYGEPTGTDQSSKQD